MLAQPLPCSEHPLGFGSRLCLVLLPPAPSCPSGQAGHQQHPQRELGGDMGRQESTCGDATCAIALIKGILERVTRAAWGSGLGRMKPRKSF